MQQLLHKLRSDESLMLAYQHGDTRAFEVLYMRHKDSLFNFLYRSLQQTAEVEELAHDAWTAVIKNISQYQTTARFKTYLYHIAHNRLVDHWRRQHKRVNLDSSTTHNEFEHQPTAKQHEPDSQHLHSEILNAIAKLPTEQRNAFLLREQGFSQKDIAEICGTGQETIKSRLRYAGQQLREHLGGNA